MAEPTIEEQDYHEAQKITPEHIARLPVDPRDQFSRDERVEAHRQVEGTYLIAKALGPRHSLTEWIGGRWHHYMVIRYSTSPPANPRRITKSRDL